MTKNYLARFALLLAVLTLGVSATSSVTAMDPASVLADDASRNGMTGLDDGRPELDILEDYLEPFDLREDHEGVRLTPELEHCQRRGGYRTGGDLPATPQVGWTNTLLWAHAGWHWDYARLTEPEFSADDGDRYGDAFIIYHRHLIEDYEDWRNRTGQPPLVAWDPMEPIPERFAYDVEWPCAPRTSEDPQVPLPTWMTREGGEEESPFWGYTSLCAFTSLNRLGKAMDVDYHGRVHEDVGGDMDSHMASLRDPVFWAWHKYLDDIAVEWETCHDGNGTKDSAGPSVQARESGSSWLAAAAVAAAASVLAVVRKNGK